MGEQKRERMSDRIGQFVAVPVSFVNDMRISPRAFRLFVVLRSYTSANDGRDLVFPGYETLRARCGFSSYTFVAEAVRELEKAGWIERHKRFGKSTHYFITQPFLHPSVEMDAPPVLQTVVASVLQPSVGTVLQPSVDYLEPETKNQKKPEVERPRRKTAGFASVLTEHGDARVAAYMDILAQKQITDTTAALIMERIGRDDIEVWRQILTAWAIGGDRGPYRADNLSGMFERFDATKNSKRFKTAVAQPIGEWRPAKGMYPQVPDKPQPPPAPRKATMFGIEVDTVDHSKTTEVPF